MMDWNLVQEHGPLVWRTVCRFLRHEADAADCFQTTFVAAVELARAQTVRDWPAFLRRIATLRALELLRRRRVERTRLVPLGEVEPPPRPSSDPGAVAQAHELADRLRAALAELEPRQADVFALTALEGFSYQETAGALNLTVDHVGVLLHRARSSLRQRLRAFAPAAVPAPCGKEPQP